TITSNVAAVEPPPGRPDLEPAVARRMLSRLVFLPVSPALRPAERDALVVVTRRHAGAAGR
ncbi:MAG: hypothetical protein ACRD0D_00585, partial [Acidimicrobiales bacterium]